MRKIEFEMIQAIRNKNDWSKANTSVSYDDTNDQCIVRLHGNLIAITTDNCLTVKDGGWQSNTTKSRLNALCDGLLPHAGDGVFQQQWKWYVKEGNEITDFNDGYTFLRV